MSKLYLHGLAVDFHVELGGLLLLLPDPAPVSSIVKLPFLPQFMKTRHFRIILLEEPRCYTPKCSNPVSQSECMACNATCGFSLFKGREEKQRTIAALNSFIVNTTVVSSRRVFITHVTSSLGRKATD